jgi:hypothetical protein
MKNNIITIMLTATMLASCTKEKETTQPQLGGVITFSGVTYVMKTGIQQYYGLRDGIHFTNLYLYSEGINVTTQNGNVSLIGTGTELSIELRKAGQSIEGVYDLVNDSLITVQLLLNQSYQKDAPPTTLEFSSGTVTIGKSGDNLRFNFNIRTSLNASLMGNFTGQMLYFDYSK